MMQKECSKMIATIQYFGQPAKVACDGNCQKAWGISVRPKIQLSIIEDDFAYLADGELGIAPVDPGTTEGRDRKPLSPAEFPNKWCVRQCERCVMSDPDNWQAPLALSDFSRRVYNMPWRHGK